MRMTQKGGKRRQTLFDIEAGSVPLQECGDSESVAKLMKSGAKMIRGTSQIDLAGQFLEIYQSGLKLAQNRLETGGKQQGTLIASTGLQLRLGELLYELNDLPDATVHIQRSDDFFKLSENWGRIYSYTMQAFIKQAEGEIEAALDLFRKACAIEDGLYVRRSYTSNRPSLMKLGILLGRARPEAAHLLTDAARRIGRLEVHPGDDVDFASPAGYPRAAIYSDLASLLIAQSRPAEALPLLTRLLGAANTMERYGDETRYLVLLALAYHALV